FDVRRRERVHCRGRPARHRRERRDRPALGFAHDADTAGRRQARRVRAAPRATEREVRRREAVACRSSEEAGEESADAGENEEVACEESETRREDDSAMNEPGEVVVGRFEASDEASVVALWTEVFYAHQSANEARSKLARKLAHDPEGVL